ncbi:MAG: adenosine-specific kinase [Candidatus Omnitrophota bacterium]|nr:adenosine-specific kinase [Candidatus Omnitrophota bacterium]
MESEIVKIEKAAEQNIILGQSHFIKTVEDIYEALVNTVPGIKCGLAFCESSGPCLVRSAGTDEELKKCAVKNALAIGAGHTFIVILKNAYPINVLKAIKDVPEVCSIYCATANDVEVITAETHQGKGILGVIDGSKPKGVETEKDIKDRKQLLRKIGYKL